MTPKSSKMSYVDFNGQAKESSVIFGVLRSFKFVEIIGTKVKREIS